MKKNVTIKDIAKIANVSISTVSRVLNNDKEVSEKTKAKVEKIIQEMNYYPSMFARGMISKKTNMIAVIVSDITNPYFSLFISYLEQQFVKSGYTLSLFDTQTANKNTLEKNVQLEQNIFNLIIKSNFDAVLILGGLIDYTIIDPGYHESLKKLCNHTPVIIVGRSDIKQNNCTFIPRNQSISTSLITNHLIQKGYTKIAFIGGTKNVWITKKRTQVYLDTLKNNKIDANEALIINNNFYAKDGYEGVSHLIDQNVEFDSILAINDRVAQGALRAVKDFLGDTHSKGIASCEFFNDSQYNIPKITSVDHNIEALSSYTTEVLMNIIGNTDSNNSPKLIIPKLILGESC